MKYALLILVACTLTRTQADIFQFDLGPNGLNGANERPTVATSATGRELQDYDGSGHFIQYDNVSHRLELHFGWGSNAQIGGQDLSSDWSGDLHIHGPADTETSTSILYDLASEGIAEDQGNPGETSFLFDLSGDGSFKSAAYDGTIQLVDGRNGYDFAEQEAQLFGNQWYINVHSDNFPGGEIRGQLLNAVPEPQHYAAMAGLALLGFAGYRRLKVAKV